MTELLGRTGDGHGRCGSLVGAEDLRVPGCAGLAEIVRGGGGTGMLAVGTPVTTVVTRVDPENIEVVKLVRAPGGGRADVGAVKVPDNPVCDVEG